MRKLVVMMFVLLFVLSGCARKESEEDIRLEKYKYIYQTVSDNDSFLEHPLYYDLNVTMSRLAEDEYRYDITIDNPQRAMYDIQVMAIENNMEYSLANKMMPTIGILDNQSINMVPYQIDHERGYVKGLILSGTTDDPVVNLKIRVSYKDYLLVVETKEYYSITIDYASQFAEEGETTEDAAADTAEEGSEETSQEASGTTDSE